MFELRVNGHYYTSHESHEYLQEIVEVLTAAWDHDLKAPKLGISGHAHNPENIEIRELSPVHVLRGGAIVETCLTYKEAMVYIDRELTLELNPPEGSGFARLHADKLVEMYRRRVQPGESVLEAAFRERRTFYEVVETSVVDETPPDTPRNDIPINE